jgi:hypothetical protein
VSVESVLDGMTLLEKGETGRAGKARDESMKARDESMKVTDDDHGPR